MTADLALRGYQGGLGSQEPEGSREQRVKMDLQAKKGIRADQDNQVLLGLMGLKDQKVESFIHQILLIR